MIKPMENISIRLAPILFTLLLIVWTVLVSPYSKYGDNWAIYPALSILPIVLLWHVYLCVSQHPRSAFIIYALIHMIILLAIWLICLMKISKDAF
jgi:hypothetical protein